jgi:hypothetical protein
MTEKLIEESWKLVIETNFPNGFCCDEHRELYRELFFTGAMAAMTALTGWDPSEPQILSINMRDMAAVRDELTVAYHATMAKAEARPEAVRH